MPSDDGVEGFMFGADPEFHLYSADGRFIGAHDYLPSDSEQEFGCNGCSRTAELRSRRPFATLTEMFKFFTETLPKRGYSEFCRERIPDVVFSYASLATEYAAGGHISISKDEEWAHSSQGLITLPFWFGVLGPLCNPAGNARIRHFRDSHYGLIGDLETKAYGRMFGVEYRNLATWLAPQNKEYRKMIQKMILTILRGDKDKQVEYVRKTVSAITGSTFNPNPHSYFRTAYGGGQILPRHSYYAAWTRLTDKFVSEPLSAIAIMKEKAAELNYTEMNWLLEMLSSEALVEYNPSQTISPGTYWHFKIPRKFADAREALMALVDTYRSISNQRTVWKAGDRAVAGLGIGWALQTTRDYLTDEVRSVPRDVETDNIAVYSAGLALLTVGKINRRIDNTVRASMQILGARESRGTPTTQFFVPMSDREFVRCPAIMELCNTMGINIDTWDQGSNVGMKMELRMSSSHLRYYLPALYIIYKMGFITHLGNASLPPEYLTVPRIDDDLQEYDETGDDEIELE